MSETNKNVVTWRYCNHCGEAHMYDSGACPRSPFPEPSTALETLSEDQKQVIRAFFRAVEQRAEANMLTTGKLEGAHYAAMRSIMAEKGITGD